nr:MAG TPA: protease [Caudoviricetes sp.]
MNRPYTDFRNEWLGKRIDYDRGYAYQCVDLAKLYLDKVV